MVITKNVFILGVGKANSKKIENLKKILKENIENHQKALQNLIDEYQK